MPTKSPKTPFSTRLSGSAKETELRIRNIFQWQKKRPPVLLLILVLLVAVSCGGLVSCQQELEKLEQDPASAQIMELLKEIGTSFDQIQGRPGMQYRSVAIPNASGQCIGDAQGGVLYFFFGAQDFPGLADLSAEYSHQLKCAGIVCTVGELYPEMTEKMSAEDFCAALGVSEYTYGSEDKPDQGWLQFFWEDYTVWVDTNGGVTESDDTSNRSIKPDYTVLVLDEKLVNENALIRDQYWKNNREDAEQFAYTPGLVTVHDHGAWTIEPMAELSTTKRNWLSDLPVAELPREAADLYGLFRSDLWRDMLIPLAYDEAADVTLYGVVNGEGVPEGDRIALNTWYLVPDGLVVRCGNKAVYHPLEWGEHLRRSGNPELYVDDFDGDGVDEAAVQIYVGHGTGCAVYQLYIFELDTLSYSVPDCSTLEIGVVYDPETRQATLTSGEQSVTVEVPEQVPEFEEVYIGNIIHFTYKAGQLYFHAGLDFYRTLAYLAEVKAPVVYENGQYCLGKVESLTKFD